jgi:hypothetical protein
MSFQLEESKEEAKFSRQSDSPIERAEERCETHPYIVEHKYHSRQQELEDTQPLPKENERGVSSCLKKSGDLQAITSAA